jgi:hypothetical protein
MPADPAPLGGLTDQSWRGLAVGLAIASAIVLLLVAVVVAMRGGDEDPAAAPTSTSAASTTLPPATAVPGGQPSDTGGPPTTRKPTPVPIVAADDRRVVVLDQSGGAPPRTLFDLGPSVPTDQDPPFIGGVSLSSDGLAAYFEVAGSPPEGEINRVQVSGGPAQKLGPGVAPVPSPDGSMLALIQTIDPDLPPNLVLRAMNGGNERRIDLGEGTCGNIAWSPSRREVAVDLCSGEEPFTVALVDVASSGVRPLVPPEGTTWSVPAYKPDGTLTLVEQREQDAAVVALAPDQATVAATFLRRPSATITTIDWSAAGDLLVCDANGIVVAVIGGKTEQVATGFNAAVW